MLIFGHLWIESPKFYKIETINDINQTPPNSLLYIENLSKNIELIKFCQKNQLQFSIKIDTIKEAIFANIFDAKYIITTKKLAKELTPIAQNYLFDTQVLALISEDFEIEEMAKIGVDGVVFINNFNIL